MDTEIGRRILQPGFDGIRNFRAMNSDLTQTIFSQEHLFQIGGAAKAKETFRYNTHVPECLLFLYHTISF